MKKSRLQFRHYRGVFDTREKAYKYLDDIVNSAYSQERRLDESLMGEPIVVVYKDTNDTPQAIVCVGVEGELGDSALTHYHIVDTAKINEEIEGLTSETGRLDDVITSEITRAEAQEQGIQAELDITQAGAGLDNDGHYVPNTGSTYLTGVTSLMDADVKLDLELSRVETARKNITGQNTDSYVPNLNLVERPITYINSATSLNDADIKLDEALLGLARVALQNIVVNGVSGTVSNNISSLGISGSSIPIGQYEQYTGRATEEHEIHNDYSVLEAVKQLDTNFTNDISEINTRIDNEIGRATSAEQLINGSLNALSSATATFSSVTSSEIARLNGIDNTTISSLNTLSGVTEVFSGATVSEIARLNSADNSINSSLRTLSGSTESLSAGTVSEIARIDATAVRNKVKSTGGTITVSEAAEGTNIETNIDDKTILSNNGELKTGLKIASVPVNNLESNVREAFRLVDNEGTPVDNTIVKIYKSSSLISVELVTISGIDYVRITYLDNQGTVQTMDLNIQQLVFEAEFKDGLTVNNNGEVKIKIDATSESFLSVSLDGLKLSGVQTAINTSVASETSRATSAEQSITNSLNGLSGQTIALSGATVGEITRLSNIEAATSNAIEELSGRTVALSAATVEEVSRLDDSDASIINSLNGLSAQTIALSGATNGKFTLMESDWTTIGSIKHTIDDLLIKAIAEGTVEDASKSLIRYYNDGVEHKYYVSSNTRDMYYGNQSLSTTIDNITHNITSLSSATGTFSAATVDEIDNLTNTISAEISRATSAEQSISGIVNTFSASTVAFSAATVDEVSRLDNADNFISGSVYTLSAATNSEISRLEGIISGNQETALSLINNTNNEIDAVETGAGLNSNGTYKPHNTLGDMGNYIQLAASIDNATFILDGALKSEETRATTAEQSISGTVNTFSAATDSLIQTLQSQLSGANETIESLMEDLQELSGVVQTMQSTMAQTIYTTVKAIIQGTNAEIKVTPNDSTEKLTIGFADNAVFGQLNN